MLQSALPIAERDLFDENSEVTPIEVFCKVRNKWLIDGEGIAMSNVC